MHVTERVMQNVPCDCLNQRPKSCLHCLEPGYYWARASDSTDPEDRTMVVISGAHKPYSVALHSIALLDAKAFAASDFVLTHVFAKDAPDNVTAVLMSKEFPAGFKLEELIDLIIRDLTIKNNYLDDSPTSVLIAQNNAGIINALTEARQLQEATMNRLRTIQEDNSPLLPRRV